MVTAFSMFIPSLTVHTFWHLAHFLALFILSLNIHTFFHCSYFLTPCTLSRTVYTFSHCSYFLSPSILSFTVHTFSHHPYFLSPSLLSLTVHTFFHCSYFLSPSIRLRAQPHLCCQVAGRGLIETLEHEDFSHELRGVYNGLTLVIDALGYGNEFMVTCWECAASDVMRGLCVLPLLDVQRHCSSNE